MTEPRQAIATGGAWARVRLLVVGVSPLTAAGTDNPVELLEVRRIWDRAPHNAFTDLVRFKGRWFCVFREGAAHVSPDGALRVITSKNSRDWTSAALLTYGG